MFYIKIKLFLLCSHFSQEACHEKTKLFCLLPIAECNILNAQESMKEARLVLVFLTQKIIKDAMSLLGIRCPEEM